MNIYHTSVPQAHVDLVDTIVPSDLKRFASELAHRLNFKVLGVKYNKDAYNKLSQYANNPDVTDVSKYPLNDPAFSEYKEAVHRLSYTTKVLMGYESGIPVCSLRIGATDNRMGERVTEYFLQSKFISKDKGRGEDRITRTSTKITQLVRILEKALAYQKIKTDWDMLEGSIGKESGSLIYRISQIIENSVDMPWRGVDLPSDAVVALLENFFNKTPISASSPEMAKIEKAWTHYQTINMKTNQRDEYFKHFRNDLAVIYETSAGNGFSFMQLKWDPVANQYSPKGPIKHCTSIDDLAEHNTEFVVHYKMWRVGNEDKMEAEFNKSDKKTVVPQQDYFYKDFDTVTLYERSYVVDEERLFVTTIGANSVQQ